jgi:hypothetical protein
MCMNVSVRKKCKSMCECMYESMYVCVCVCECVYVCVSVRVCVQVCIRKIGGTPTRATEHRGGISVDDVFLCL